MRSRPEPHFPYWRLTTQPSDNVSAAACGRGRRGRARDAPGKEETEERKDWERHRLTARGYNQAAPPYRIQAEDDGTLTLRIKAYRYREQRVPEAATRWEVISRHADLEEAARRRHR
jgi:hypothetical protein